MQNFSLKSESLQEQIPSLAALKKPDANVKAIQEMLKKNGVKMSAIEIRELMKTGGLTPDETKIKAYVRQLRHGF